VFVFIVGRGRPHEEVEDARLALGYKSRILNGVGGGVA